MIRFSYLQVLLLSSLLMLAVSSTVTAEEAAVPETPMDQETATSAPAAPEETSAVLTISRFVTCQKVEDHEPVGETNAFAAGTETVYAFLEATEISADAEINVVWIYQENEVARVPLNIRKGNRWRTYSSKQLAGRPGDWRVEVQDNKASTLASLDFTAE